MTKQRHTPRNFTAAADAFSRRHLPASLQDLHRQNMQLLEALKKDLATLLAKKRK